MKKFLIALVIVLCLAGVGILGYFVFNAKSVETVEIEGNAQTLYFVGECSTPDFEDAKLKVTYKNGTMKYISLSSNSVKVSGFSTTTENHGEMKITYKSQTLSLEYNVIKVGYYYVKQSTTYTGSSTVGTTVTTSSISSASTLLFLDDDGALKYYRYSSTEAAWLLYDGKYDSDFNWSISGDTLVLNYLEGSTKVTESITASYENGSIILSSTNDTLSSAGLVTQRVVKVYGCNSNYRDATISSISDSLYVASGTTSTVNSKNVICFKVGDTIASSGTEVYFKVTYSSPIITFYDDSGSYVTMLGEVYVMLTDEMLALDTTTSTSSVSTGYRLTYLCYENYSQTTIKYEIYYTVSNS